MSKLYLLPPIKVAEELLLVDSCALRKIRAKELEGESWLGERKVELCPNITTMVDHFNSLALLVPTEILAETTPQMRAKVISRFIKVAEACHQLKNYHSLKAVLAGLQCTPVYRLRKTWKRVPLSRMKIFKALSRLMAEEGNCMLYYKEMHKNLQNKVPFVPYLGFFLTQVVHQTCHQNMRNRQGMRRKGAIMKRYKVLTSLTNPSSRPCNTYKSSFSCPNGNSLDSSNDSVGWSTAQRQVIPDISYSYDDENINGEHFRSFSHGDSQRSASLPHNRHLHYIHSASTTSSLFGYLHAPSEYSTSSSTHSHTASSDSSIESSDLCGPINQTLHPLAVSQNMSASLCNLGPEHEMNIGLTSCHSDTALHQLNTTSKEDDLLGLSCLRVGSSSVSLSTHSPSPAQSGLSSPCAGTSADDEQSSRHEDFGLHSAKCSDAASSVDEDESPFASIYLSGTCSVEDTEHDKSSAIHCLKVAHEDTDYEHMKLHGVRDPPTIASDDMWDSQCPDSGRPAVHLDSRRHAIHMEFQDIQDAKMFLMVYQMCSLGCGIEIKERVDIGNLTTDYHFNTEAENYVLSYKREPKMTHKEISEGELHPSHLTCTLDRTGTEGSLRDKNEFACHPRSTTMKIKHSLFGHMFKSAYL